MGVQMYVVCDECGEKSDYGWTTLQACLADNREAGWSIGKRTICPQCRAVG